MSQPQSSPTTSSTDLASNSLPLKDLFCAPHSTGPSYLFYMETLDRNTFSQFPHLRGNPSGYGNYCEPNTTRYSTPSLRHDSKNVLYSADVTGSSNYILDPFYEPMPLQPLGLSSPRMATTFPLFDLASITAFETNNITDSPRNLNESYPPSAY